MNNIVKISVRFAIVIALVFQSNNSFSQAFGGKGSKQFLLGIGLSQHYTVYPSNGKGPVGNYTPSYGGISAQLEFGISKYIGVGGSLGFEVADNIVGSAFVGNNFVLGGPKNSSFVSLGVPIGFLANFHFLQLIADKTGKNFAQNMDVYGGLSIGSGPAFAIAKSGSKNFGNDVGFLIYGGPHVGFRYFPSEAVGVYVEAGYGKSFVSAGLAVKF